MSAGFFSDIFFSELATRRDHNSRIKKKGSELEPPAVFDARKKQSRTLIVAELAVSRAFDSLSAKEGKAETSWGTTFMN